MICSNDFTKLSNLSFDFCRGAVEYIHSSKDKSGTAYDLDESINISFKIPRAIGSTEIIARIFEEEKEIASYELNWIKCIGSFDYYELSIPSKSFNTGIYFFYIEISGLAKLYGVKNGREMLFSKNLSNERFQLTVYDFKYPLTQERYGGIIYHIFVDRFFRARDTLVRDDAVYISDWDSDIVEYPEYPGAFLKNNTFYGGNLYGVVEKLDYIKSLGVSVIYLSPIFEAYSNHKYDVGDYSKVDDGFGGEEALKRLIKECKKRNIAIILDGVFNHTGANSVYFNKFGKYDSLGAYNSKNSKYYDWYDFQDYPNKYTCWWGIEILPRINPNIKSCSDFFVGKRGIIEKYTAMGIDGFRLDVVDELSDVFVSKIKNAQNNVSSDTFLYGEVWEDASNKIAYGTRKRYYCGEELDGVMNYPLRKGIIDYILYKKTDSLEYAIFDVFFNMPKRIRDLSMNLLGTHDTERILTVLGGVSSDGKSNAELRDIRMNTEEYSVAKRRLKLAYTVLATLPGLPTIFYGDEAGMQGYSDPFNRRTFPWNNMDGELLSHYTSIGKLRNCNSVYKEGELEVIRIDENCLVFSRFDENDKIITFVNNSNLPITVYFERKCEELLSGKKIKSISVLPESAIVFSLNQAHSFEFN